MLLYLKQVGRYYKYLLLFCSLPKFTFTLNAVFTHKNPYVSRNRNGDPPVANTNCGCGCHNSRLRLMVINSSLITNQSHYGYRLRT